MADYGADQWRWEHGVLKGHEDELDIELPAPPPIQEIVSRGDINELIEVTVNHMRDQLNAHTKMGDVYFPEKGVFRHASGTTKSNVIVDLKITVVPRESN